MVSRILLVIASTSAIAALASTADAAPTPRMFGPARSPAPHVAGVAGVATRASRLCDTTADVGQDTFASQNFEGEYDAYDSMGAQSCTLISRRARIKGVYVVGTYFDGGGPARSESVIFWTGAAGLPGIILSKQTVEAPDPMTGEFDIPLRPVTIRKAASPTFWFTVQINMDFGTHGQWSWWASQAPHGVPDVWENPGNGFELCQAWCTLDTVYPDAVSFLAALEAGRARGK